MEQLKIKLSFEEDELNKVAKEIDRRDPKHITDYWRMVWKVDGKKAGLSIQVPDFPSNSIGLKTAEDLGGGPIYIPPEVKQSRYLLALMWPEMSESLALKQGQLFPDSTNHSGWRYVANSLNAPYLGTTEGEMKAILGYLGAESINLTELVIGARDSWHQTGHYLDERTWARILPDSLAVHFFKPPSRLRILSGLDPDSRCLRLGFRWSMPVLNPLLGRRRF